MIYDSFKIEIIIEQIIEIGAARRWLSTGWESSVFQRNMAVYLTITTNLYLYLWFCAEFLVFCYCVNYYIRKALH